MSSTSSLKFANAAATFAAGECVACKLDQRQIDPFVIFLRGDLGVGKSTFARGFLAGLGYPGRVPSPTYTLIEPYEVGSWRVYHIDLYRLEHPAEVTELAIAELLAPGAILLVEWPERGAGELPAPDLEIALELDVEGRNVTYTASSERAAALLGSL